MDLDQVDVSLLRAIDSLPIDLKAVANSVQGEPELAKLEGTEIERRIRAMVSAGWIVEDEGMAKAVAPASPAPDAGPTYVGLTDEGRAVLELFGPQADQPDQFQCTAEGCPRRNETLTPDNARLVRHRLFVS